MKKRFLACLLALCLLVCFAPAAFAAEGDAVPQVANMSIAYDGTDIVKENANGTPEKLDTIFKILINTRFALPPRSQAAWPATKATSRPIAAEAREIIRLFLIADR